MSDYQDKKTTPDELSAIVVYLKKIEEKLYTKNEMYETVKRALENQQLNEEYWKKLIDPYTTGGFEYPGSEKKAIVIRDADHPDREKRQQLTFNATIAHIGSTLTSINANLDRTVDRDASVQFRNWAFIYTVVICASIIFFS